MLVLAIWIVLSVAILYSLRRTFRHTHIFNRWDKSNPSPTSTRAKFDPKSRDKVTTFLKATSARNEHSHLSISPALIKPEYDVVVIGSGYGGGVAASRMARAGRSVCVLERGAEKWPGEYPHKFKDAMREYRVSGRVLSRNISVGKPSGLYHTIKGDGQDVFLACGLGGTSLINAGVFLRAEKKLLESREWPAEIRGDTEELSNYYARAERMLQPTSYPSTYPTPFKLATLEDQARNLGVLDRFYRPPLTTFFQSGTNNVGTHMRPSRGTGNESTGTNDGSKNSVLVTYIADAWTWGAELFCGVDVRYVREEQRGSGYIVFYELTDERGEKRKLWVRAKKLLFLGAGALGTSEILLRSQNHGLATSPLVGQRLSGNGDMLSFAYNCKRDYNSIGCEASKPTLERPCGPSITGCIDMRGLPRTRSVRDGYILQDGVIPEVLASVMLALLETQTTQIPSKSYDTIRGFIARAKSWTLGPYTKNGSLRRTFVFLTMSHDENEATMTLEDNMRVIQWSGIGDVKRSAKIDSFLRGITESMGGIFTKAPQITVHPLGGAVMSNDGTGFGGAVNHIGQVFTGTGHDIYEGIVCVDGSIIPTSLGVNPCATITALAERCCDVVVREQGWEINESLNEPVDLGNPAVFFPLVPKALRLSHRMTTMEGVEGVQFEETLVGYLHIGADIADFHNAEKIGKDIASSARLSITVDAHRAKEDSYLGSPSGTFACAALSRDPLLITKGVVKFFTVDEDVSDATNFVYDLELLSTEGMRYGFHGYKRIDSTSAFSLLNTWSATTTLFTTITEAHGSIVVGRGILRLSLRAFVSEMRSLRSRNHVSIMIDLSAQAKFLKFFANNVASYSLSPFRQLQYPPSFSDTTGYFNKAIPDEIIITAEDGTRFPVYTWEPAPGISAKELPIVFIPGASVNEQIFSLPTVPTNAIDYFTALGYRCYVPVIRFGFGNPARKGDTVYDSRLDVRAAIKYVREREQEKQTYVVAHCLGSIAMAIALLNGDVEAHWIKGLTCSQVFTNLIFSRDNALKAKWEFIIRTYRRLAGPWFSCHSSPSSPWFQYLLDQALRFYPVGSRRELCNSSVCHRCDVPFGRCWSHANLNRATHAHLDRFFDGIHMNFVSHLSKMGATPPHHVRTNQGRFEDLVTEANLKRLEGIKICFLSGGDNAVWKPKSTKESYDLLRGAFPEGCYDRVVVKGYGHLDCWMGKKASVDVFPRVRHHVEFCEGIPGINSSFV